MKKLLICLACLFVAAAAQAAPTFKADVTPNTDKCDVFLNAQPPVRIAATSKPVTAETPTGRVCWYDLAATPDGTYSGTMTALSVPDALTGKIETSAKAPAIPFVLPLPPAPTVPGVPQNPKLTRD